MGNLDTFQPFFLDTRGISQGPYTEESSQSTYIEEPSGSPRGFVHTGGSLQSTLHVQKEAL